MTRKLFVCISASALFIIACGGLPLVVSPTPPPAPSATATPFPSPTPPATITPILFPTETPTATPSETPLPTLTFTPTLTSESPFDLAQDKQWVMQGPDQVIVPILLYHHIGFSLRGDTVYYVSPDAFDRQMNLLYQWGYKTISLELLVRVIEQGAELPPKPILLTFDDGSETTYITALPILQRYGFTGVSYLVYNYIGIPNYMNKDQILALYAAGWEIGSHSLSHVDLTTRPDRQADEIVESRRKLQILLGIPILSFAYPFGAYDSDSLNYVHKAGYTSAMGLGKESLQASKNLFYLYRQAVTGTDDLKMFALMLPWRQEQYDVPAVTIVP